MFSLHHNLYYPLNSTTTSSAIKSIISLFSILCYQCFTFSFYLEHIYIQFIMQDWLTHLCTYFFLMVWPDKKSVSLASQLPKLFVNLFDEIEIQWDCFLLYYSIFESISKLHDKYRNLSCEAREVNMMILTATRSMSKILKIKKIFE